MDFSKGVLFDPGYAKYTVPFAQNIDAAYNMLFSLKAMHQRKFKFRILYPQLLRLLENTVYFYLGCLFWATFIKKNFNNEPKTILDNYYLDKEIDEETLLYEVNYVLNYIEKLKKDCKFYLSTECNIPQDWTQIVEIYKEFLTINKFLTNARTTDALILPSQIKDLSQNDLDSILNVIDDVVKTGEFRKLFEIKSLIF